MVAYSATIQLLIQLQEEIGVLLYSGEEDQLTKPFHWLPEFEWTVAKSATVATIEISESASLILQSGHNF